MSAVRTLGVDIGSTTVKATIIGTRPLAVLASAAVEHGAMHAAGAKVEHDPAAWWSALRTALSRLGPIVGSVDAVAISGQGSTVAYCDQTGRPTSSALGWNDQRAADIADQLRVSLAADLARAHGNGIGDGPEPRLMWVAEHEPQRAAAASLVLGVASMAAVELGGRPALNTGDAGSWLSFNRHRRAWDDVLASRLDVSALLPELAEPGDLLGVVDANGQARYGVPAGAAIVASTTDLGAAALSAGTGLPGEVLYSKGTGGFLCTHVERVANPTPLLALPLDRGGTSQLISSIDTLGSAYDWCRRLLGDLSHGAAERALAAAMRAEAAPCLLPWFAGANHPVVAPRALAVITGLSLSSDAGSVLRGLLEGTSALAADHLAVAEAVTGRPVERLVVSGGPTANLIWNRLDAAAFERPILVSRHSGAAIGSALIAAQALGAIQELGAAGSELGGPTLEVEPEPTLVARARRTRAELVHARTAALALAG